MVSRGAPKETAMNRTAIERDVETKTMRAPDRGATIIESMSAQLADTETASTPNVERWTPSKHMTVKHHFVGGIYTKECHLPVGYWFGQHRHSFDHQSVLVSGTAIVEVDGVQTTYEGPAILTIKARTNHKVIPLTPVVWLCQHVTSCTDPEDIDIELMAEEV